MTRESAARFSFLLSLPIIGGAGLFKGAQLAKGGGMPAGIRGAASSGACVSAAVSGYVVIAWLLRYLRRGLPPVHDLPAGGRGARAHPDRDRGASGDDLTASSARPRRHRPFTASLVHLFT